MAAVNGQEEIVKLLLAKNPDLNAKDWTGYTATDLAKQKGHSNIVKLLEQAVVNKK